MNKKINAIFTGLGLVSQIFYLWNAFNIWFRHIGIFHRDNYKIVNIFNYIAVVLLVVSTGLLVMPW